MRKGLGIEVWREWGLEREGSEEGSGEGPGYRSREGSGSGKGSTEGIGVGSKEEKNMRKTKVAKYQVLQISSSNTGNVILIIVSVLNGSCALI